MVNLFDGTPFQMDLPDTHALTHGLFQRVGGLFSAPQFGGNQTPPPQFQQGGVPAPQFSAPSLAAPQFGVRGIQAPSFSRGGIGAPAFAVGAFHWPGEDAFKTSATATTGSTVTGGVAGTASTGMKPGVSKWAAQAKATFSDLGADVPDVMLAIMTNESGGDPNAYNTNGDAWGLFQQLHLNSNDPNVQFAAAHQLAQQKLAEIAASYAKNGLNPDTRTRALDLALAWAGHFDYATGRQSTTSVDYGVGGQTAADLAKVFLDNYDAIKAGRSATGNSGKGGVPGWNNSITPGVNGSIMQEFGSTDYSVAHPDTYAYGNAYGLVGSQHPGVDWAVPMGTAVATPVGGTVFVVGNDHGTGYYYRNTMSNSNPDTSGEFAIQLDNGDILILGHLSAINVQVGQHLNAGDLIGLSGGSDGAHVHVEYRKKDGSTPSGYRIVDPRGYIK